MGDSSDRMFEYSMWNSERNSSSIYMFAGQDELKIEPHENREFPYPYFFPPPQMRPFPGFEFGQYGINQQERGEVVFESVHDATVMMPFGMSSSQSLDMNRSSMEESSSMKDNMSMKEFLNPSHPK